IDLEPLGLGCPQLPRPATPIDKYRRHRKVALRDLRLWPVCSFHVLLTSLMARLFLAASTNVGSFSTNGRQVAIGQNRRPSVYYCIIILVSILCILLERRQAFRI
ncbi:hypothetical protein, partial [Xanthomonas oryzae]|uniref:hypothetical protein n=1 Tax=Xanthomonas oryzae TaxID=347 RepID=UPI001ED988CA